MSALLGAVLTEANPPDVQHDFTGGTLPSWVTFSRTSHGTYFDSTGKLTYAQNNLLTNTDTLTGWTQTSVTITTGQADPFGGTGGIMVAASASGTGPTLALNPNARSGPSAIYSVYVKKGSSATTANLFTVRNSTTGTNLLSVKLNYDTGVITYSIGSSGVSATNIGNGWWRLTLQPPSGISVYDSLTVGCCFNGTTVTNGDYAYVYGLQLEAVTYATTPSSYVATTSAAYYGPRFDYDPVTLAARGLLLEDSRTNIVQYTRDLTQSSKWTVSNVTAAKDQTGLDGVDNSASSIVASAGNGTILQAITLASSARYQTAYVKRITGSGVINMTMDGGTTWVDVTSQISSSWARVSIPSQTVTNPSVGFQIVTNGDKIAVDCVQNENGAFATSPIITGGAAYQRTFDSAYLTGAAATIAQAASGTAIMQTTLLEDVSTTHYLLASSSSRRTFYISASNTTCSIYNGTNSTQPTIGGSGTWTGGAVRAGAAWGASSWSIGANNGTVATGAYALGSTASAVYLGANSSTNNMCGWLASMALYTIRLPDAQLKYKTTVNSNY